MKLEVKNLTKSFGEKEVLHGISFDVEGGKALGLLGRNGAGKTTTIRIIMDVFHANSGEIFLDGKKFNPKEHLIGYLPEERGLYPKKKVSEQLVYLGRLRGLSKAEAKKNTDKWLKRLQVSQYTDVKLETLSKGNQQKVQLDHLAGLQTHAAHPNPVGRTVLLRTDGQRQGQQQHRAAHHHVNQERPAPHIAHQHNASQHDHDAHAVIHGLLHAAGGSAVQIGGIEDQHSQRAQKIGDGQQQLIRREKPGQPHGRHVDQRRNDHAQGQTLPGDLTLQRDQQKGAEEKQHHGRAQSAVGAAAMLTLRVARTVSSFHRAPPPR